MRTNNKERRNSPREPGRIFACILEESSFRQLDQAFCVVVDVSEGGMRIRTPQPPVSGSPVTVRVAIGETISQMGARVVRVTKVGPSTYDVGLVLLVDEFRAQQFLQAVRNNQVELQMAAGT